MVNGSVGPIATALRTLFAAIDIPVYWLLKFNFELFFNIATFNLVDGKMIFDLFSRIQLIIGVFMLFELTMVIIKGIVNPDSFTDAKNGAANVIKRVVIALLLLALLVPLNITSPKNEYEKQINNNGILFGTLYSLQNRLLSSNTLGRLILGDEYTNYEANDLESNNLNEFANRFTSTIVRTFYQPNLDENGEPICSDVMDEIYDDITGKNGEGANPASIIAYSDRQCDGILDTGVGGGSYALSIMPFVSTIAGIILVVLIFMMTFNVAKRTFQLAALQLMAPIPIISYMDPKGSKDSAFNSWLKLLGTTYLELFIQLAVIYFSFGIITSFMDKFELSLGSLVSTAGDAVDKVGFWNASPLIVWTFLIMVIALFIFAKDAPKFFKQMLGIKDNGKGFFSAFGTAMGLGTAAVGAIGSARIGYKTAAEENAKLHPNENNRMRNVGSAILAGMGGGYAGVKAAMNDKGGGVAGVMEAQRKHRADRAGHKTFLRGLKDDVLSTATGESPAEAGKKRIAFHKAFQDAQKNWKSSLETEATNNGVACNLGNGVQGTYRDLVAALENAYEKKDAAGNALGKFIKLKNSAGVEIEHRADQFTPTYKEEALKAQVLSYQQGNTKVGGTSYTDNVQIGGKLYINYETLKKSRDDIGSYVIDDPNISDADRQRLANNFNDAAHGGNYDINDIYTYGKALGASNAAMSAEQNSMRNIINNANTKENKK